MQRKSPTKSEDQVLGMLSVDETKAFLLDSINLPWAVDYPEARPHFERWLKRWQRLFTYKAETEDAKWKTMQVPREPLELFAPIVRTTLCRLWGERDARQRDWYFYRLRDAHRQMVRHLEGWPENDAVWGGAKTVQRLLDYALQDVPRLSPFEAAVYWLQINQKLMVYCEGPVCPAPYFFRMEKGQKYCSPECADPVRRQAKLKWWNENRKSQRNKK
ncbi:MAG: hypothetical protein WBQ76_13940 [Candidatus Korobacteraceae bacterium]